MIDKYTASPFLRDDVLIHMQNIIYKTPAGGYICNIDGDKRATSAETLKNMIDKILFSRRGTYWASGLKHCPYCRANLTSHYQTGCNTCHKSFLD